jgi:hypothetical protein
MEPGFLEWAVGQSGIAGLAIMALYTLNVNYQTALRREREYAESNRDDKKQLLEVLSQNTVALTRLASMIESMSHGYEREHTGKTAI